MSNRRYGLVLAAVFGPALAMLAVACGTTWEDYYLPLTDPKLATDGGGHEGGTGGDDGGPPPGCIPSENTVAVADTCGVFVSSSLGSDTTGKGTKSAPFATLTKALASATAKGKPVYACGETFATETVAITEDAVLHGALDCMNGWVYASAKKTQLAPTMDAIPLSISKATTSAELYDFAVTAANATQDGGSSIAVLVAQAAASFTRCDVTAGSGKAGVIGAAQAQVATPATANGVDGTDDAMCNVPGLIAGGAGGTNTCEGTITNGGNGGKGIADTNGGPGGDGSPAGATNGGVGQTKTTSCDPGKKGTDGNAGTVGTGARGIGDISASGYQAPVATLGGLGTPGQGGGGGGGARQCDANGMFAGPSGGGGGAGGCGGAPGNRGQSGGSSIGIVVLGASLTLNTVTITAKSGGTGGLGGDGQAGGPGASPGQAPMTSNACDGGKGGQGGAGGPGGGGAGGHSIGIAAKGAKTLDLGTTTIQHDIGAQGGAGGDADMSPQTKGDDGLGCKSLDFGDPTSCMK